MASEKPMKKVLVLGATGMLGHEVVSVLSKNHAVVATHRKALTPSLGFGVEKVFDGSLTTLFYRFDAEKVFDESLTNENDYYRRFVDDVGDVDYVVNCIGVTIPFAVKNPALTMFVNGVLPHILAATYKEKLIHITTDCVYSGMDGGAPYDEMSEKSAFSLYGLSKSAGEPSDFLTIRTSIIGRERDSHNGLLEWFLDAAKSGSVNGYTDHLWNGITTHQYALICDKIISAGFYPQGLYHVFSNAVTKYDMLMAFKERFHLKCDIVPVSGKPLDRRLGTIKHFNDWLRIPNFQEMVAYL